MKLCFGDKVRTLKRSKAELKFIDESIVRLHERGELTIRLRKDIKQLNLKSGCMWAKIPKGVRCEIVTPSAVAAVKGSEVEVEITDTGAAIFRVFEGWLKISNIFGSSRSKRVWKSPPIAVLEKSVIA